MAPDARVERAAPRRVLVIDPGFRGLTGHHFNSNLALGLAAPDEGVELRVLAGRSLPALEDDYPAVVERFFETDLYDGDRIHQHSADFDSWLTINARFAQDLKRLSKQTLDWADVILIPSITQFHVLALARWLRDTFFPAHGGKVVLKLMFSPTWTSWSSVCGAGPQMYRDALSLVQDQIGRRLALTSEFAASSAEFETFLGGSIPLLPHPVFWGEDHEFAARSPRGGPTIGFLGYSKREKGFHLLPEIARRVAKHYDLQDEYKQPRFLIQINHGGYDGGIIEIEEELGGMAGRSMKLLTGPLTTDAYKAAVEAVDLMLLPYDPTLYRGRGSAVFAEAVSLGVPVIAPRRSGIGDELAAGSGAGVTFERYDAAAVGAAVVAAVDDIQNLSALAASRARAWRRDNCGAGFLQRLAGIVDSKSEAV